MNITTLLFLYKDDQILLAMKKRGTGQGKYNGVGGKVKQKESILAATIRESQEEIAVTPMAPQLVATLDFQIPSQNFHNFCYVSITDQWQGEPQETAEMAPAWFSREAIPFDQMWSDDILWLPRVLAGERFDASFLFDEAEQVSLSEFRPLPAHRSLQDVLDSSTGSPKA